MGSSSPLSRRPAIRKRMPHRLHSPSPLFTTCRLDTFAQVGPRALSFPGDIFHFPTFTDYDGALNPKSVVFTSALNFKSDGTFPTADQDITGLNPIHVEQLFLAPLPAASTGPFTRLTNIPTFAGLRGLPSNSSSRIAFSLTAELGGGNTDGSNEVFYHLSPSITTESAGSISLFTGASMIPLASPAASPTTSPTASPSATIAPGFAPGLAPGELGVAQSNVALAPSNAQVSSNAASYAKRSPALPIELNGVSMSINGAACGLYSVGTSPAQISFVVPIGLVPNSGTASYPVVINNNGTVIRGRVVIVAAQPDIFTDSNGPGGRAVVCNVTDPSIPMCVIEPFNVTTPNASGTPVPTVLEVHVTGVRGTAASSITVTIGTTVIVPSNVILLDQPGFEEIDFTLPSAVDRGDLPIVVAVGTATSRPAASAPHITINP